MFSLLPHPHSLPRLVGRLSIHLLLSVFTLCMCQQIHAQQLNEDSLRQRIQDRQQPDTTRIKDMLQYANYLIKHKQEEKEGLHWLQKAQSESEKLNYSYGLAQSLLNSGNYFRQKGNWGESIAQFQELIRLAASFRDSAFRRQTLMKVYNNLGGIHNINGDFAGSLENRLQSAAYMDSLPLNPDNVAIVHLNIASDYRQLKNYASAAGHLLKVRAFLPQLNDRLKLEYYFEYYHYLVNSDQLSMATTTLQSVDSLLAIADLSPFQKLDYGLMADQLKGLFEMEHSHHYAQAILYFSKNLEDAGRLENKVERVAALYNLGWASLSNKDLSAARDWLQQSYDLALAASFRNQAYKAALLLSETLEQLNQLPGSIAFAKKAIQLQDSIYQQETVSQLQFLEARYQNEKRARQIATLERDNETQEEAIQARNRTLILVVLGAAVLSVILWLMYRNSRQKQLLAEQDRRLKAEQILFLERQQQVVSLQSMVNGQESERTRVARDLHDGLGGLFSTIKMYFSALQHEETQLKNSPLFQKSLEMVNSASEEVRRIAHNMMPEVLIKMGLVQATAELANSISAGKLMQVSLQTYGMEKRLNSSTEIMLYRILQELLNNIIRHARADQAIIQFNREGSRLSITVEDNGRGFSTREADEKTHAGLRSVESRVAYLNGELSIDSQQEVGTTVLMNFLIDEG